MSVGASSKRYRENAAIKRRSAMLAALSDGRKTVRELSEAAGCSVNTGDYVVRSLVRLRKAVIIWDNGTRFVRKQGGS